jgi:hypothetical protein
MLHDVPDRLSLALAAKLCYLSPFCFRTAFTESRVVDYARDQLNGRFYVSTSSLERAIGRRITLDEYRAADKALQPARDYQHGHRRRSMNEHALQELYRQEKR